MKAIGIIGSPRVGGNTEIITGHTLKAIEEEGIETELVRLAGLDIKPCNACNACRVEGSEERCIIKDDFMPVYTKMKTADAIILASPVYVGSATALMKAFMERSGFVALRRGTFAGKVGGPMVVARRAGQDFTFAQIIYWFHILRFIMPGSTYWNIAFGREKGDVTKDEEGMNNARDFGKNIASLVKALKASKTP